MASKLSLYAFPDENLLGCHHVSFAPPLYRSGTSTPASWDDSDYGFISHASGVSTPATELSETESTIDTGLYTLHEYVLVVGGLGYIGSHTTWELLKVGHNVIIVDNLSNSYRDVLDKITHLMKQHFAGHIRIPQLHFFEADYRDSNSMRTILEKYKCTPNAKFHAPSPISYPSNTAITSVIHFAAYKSVSASLTNPLSYYANNVSGLISFLGLLSIFNIKTFVFSSSATVYGDLASSSGRLREELCVHAHTSWIDADNNPRTTASGCTGLINPYGRTKWMSEAILSDLAAADAKWKIYALRYFNPIGCDESGVLGEDPRGTPNNLMPVVIQVLEGSLPELNVFGTDWDTRDGTAVRDFIHVTDLGRGHVAAIRHGLKRGAQGGFNAINLGTGSGSTVREVVETMEKVCGREIKVKVTGRREGDVGVCVADPGKAREMLGWVAEKTLQDCCRDIWGYLERHG